MRYTAYIRGEAWKPVVEMDAAEWNALIAPLPGAHLLQTWEWGQIKQAVGWEVLPQIWRGKDGQVKAAALILQRTVTPLKLRLLYIPRGPLLNWADADLRKRVLDDLQSFARVQRAFSLKFDPELQIGTGIPGTESEVNNPIGAEVTADLQLRGWNYSTEQIQFRNTVSLDLSGTEADWLARMKQKTRYNLRLAERKGVSVRLASEADYPLLYHMYAETSLRDGFVIRPESYYRQVWQTYSQREMAEALIAEVDGEPIAGLWLFYFARKAWYLYGMSRDVHRDKMPNYLLQWEAMRRAKLFGCESYDLWGAPDVFDESDGMWGVFRFKEGLGGTVVRTLGAWDFPANPRLYNLYLNVFPRILSILRTRGKAQTKKEVRE